MKKNKWRNIKLCFIVTQFVNPPESIVTPIFPGETEKDVKRFLNKALSTLPFRVLYSYVIDYSSDINKDILESIEIQSIDDYPGKEMVTCTAKLKWKRKYFLPRNLKTREFVDISKQVKCLEILSRPCPGQTPIAGEHPF